MLALALACGNAERPVEPGPASSATPVERSAGEHAESESNEVAEREPDEPDPVTDLLHAVPTRVHSSSAYRRDRRQVERLFDGDLETTWSSDTGDLVGAWIEVTLPDDATVTEIRMTVGFARERHGRDLFTGNHRVRQVRVSRGDETLGTFVLDVDSRSLQPLAVQSAGGTLRITVTELVEGTRTDWRETCISELRVMGRAPGAEIGAHAPTASFEAPSSDETERSAPLAPAVDVPAQATDAAYFVVQNRGLFRWSAAGQERLFDGSVVDFAADDAGQVHVLAGVRHGGGEQHLFVLEGGQRRELHAPDTSLSIVALAPDGAPVVANAFAGIWFRRGAGWSEVHEIDPSRIDIRQERPQALAVDSRGIVWVLGQRSLFRGDRGTYRREDLPERGNADLTAVAVGGGVTAVAAGPHVFIRRSRWERFACPVARLAVGGDGVVVTAFHERAAVVAEDADPVPLDIAGLVVATGVARDARGRTWVAGTDGLVVFGSDNAVLRRWSRGRVPGLPSTGTIDGLLVTGRGPELPE